MNPHRSRSGPEAPPRRGLVIAVVVVVVVAIVVVIRSRSDSATPSVAAAPGAPSALAASPSASTVSLSSTPTAGVGPTTVVGGVPMGYAHSPAGAEAAGVNFLRLDGALVGMNDQDASAAKRVIASSSAADALVANVAAKLAALRKGYPGGATLYRIGVLATRVSPASADRVRVELWYVGVVSPPGAVPYEDWTTQRYELMWERNDWHDAAEASTPGPRPLPLPGGNPSGPGQLESALSGFTPLAVAR